MMVDLYALHWGIMSTYAFEPDPSDYGPEPAHIANAPAKVPPLVRWAKTAHLPEPGAYDGIWHEPVNYSDQQMRDYGALCRKMALEEAAHECEREIMFPNGRCMSFAHSGLMDAAKAIRELIK